MPQEITVQELEAALAEAIDEDGDDARLAEATARMTPDQRRVSDENIRRWARGFRAGQKVDCDPADTV